MLGNERRALDHDDDFDDFDVDDLFGADEEEIDQPPEPPTMRITIRARRLYVEPWAPYLIGDGPHAQLLYARAKSGVTIADGWVMGPDSKELIIRYLAVADRESADRRLVRWAQSVGHCRFWLPDRLVELE